VVILTGSFSMIIANMAHAATFTWEQNTNGFNWSTSGNWSPSGPPGTGDIADISEQNITSPTTINFDQSLSIGQIIFGDHTTADNNWTLSSNDASILTLNNGVSVPVIDVLNQTATISVNLAGTNGFQKIDTGALILSGSNSALSGTVTLKRGDTTPLTNNAFGSATVVIDPGTSNNARLLLTTGGLNLSNAITMNSSNSGGGVNGSIFASTATDVTLSGSITISAVATSGGHFAESSTGFINITGTLTDTLAPNFVSGGSGNGIVVRNGNLRLSGGGSYFRIDERSGTMAVGANNGIATNAIVNLGGNGNGTLDLAGFSQTVEAISALIGANTNTVTNSSATNASTLTIAPVASSSLVTGLVNLGFGGVISDASASAPLSINIAGDATNSNIQSLTGLNTYRGSTTLTSGTLSVNTLAAGGTASSIGASTNTAANLVFNGGTLQYTGGTVSTDRSYTITGGSSGTINVSTVATNLTISGGSAATNGVLNKSGPGTLILTGANAHTGGTNVNAGTLLVNSPSGSLSTGTVSVANLATLGGNGTIQGTVVPSSGGIIAPGNPAVNTGVGTLTMGGLTLSTGALNFDFGTGNDQITVNNVNGLSVNGGTINLFNAGTNTAFTTNGTYTLINYNTSFLGSLSNLTVAASAGKVYSVASTGSAIQLTIGTATTVDWNGSADTSWANSSNWSSTFPNAIGVTARFDGSKLTGNSNTSVVLNGSKTVSGLIFDDDSSGNSYTISASGADTLNLNNGVAAIGISVANGSQNISAPIAAANTTSVTFGNSGAALTISGAISGGKPLTVGGGGTLTLTANNSFSSSSLNGGILNVGTFGGSDTSGTLGSSDINISNGATLNFNRSNAYIFAGGITGSGVGPEGTVNQMGLGTTTVSGAISNVTSVNVSAGTLIASSTISQSGGINLTNNGSLTANGGISGAGAVTMSSSGALTMAGSNSYSGGTTINSGTVILNNASAFPTATGLAVNGGTFDLHGNSISVNNVTDSTGSTGVITNNAASNTISTYNFAGNATNYDIYSALNDGAGGGKLALVSSISNTVSQNAYILHLHATSTYSGGTTVNFQSVEADADNAFGTGPISVPVNNSSINTTRIQVAGGVTIHNNITIGQGNPTVAQGGATGVIQYATATSGNATVIGTVTFQADNNTGGLFNGPTAGGTDFLNINGPVIATNSATTLIQIGGNVKYGDTTGTSSYQFIQVNGQADLWTNNALCQTAVMQMSTSNTGTASNGTFDLNGFNQTLAGLSASALTSTIQNSGTTANTLRLNTTGTNSFNGNINDTPLGNGGVTNLTVGGSGTQVLTGSSSYTGVTTLTGSAVLQASNLTVGGSSSSIGAASSAAANLVFDGGSLQYTGTSTSTDRGFTISAGKTAHIGVNTAGVNVTLLTGTNPTTTGGLEKTGPGNLTFDSTAPTYGYTGATTVSGGRLFVNNQLTNTSSISVAAGATLAGTGTIGSSASTFTHSAGTINPGVVGGASNSTLTIGGSLNLAGGTVQYDVDNSNLGNPSTLQDLVKVNGALSLTASTPIVLDFLNPGTTPGPFTYELFQFGPGSTITTAQAQADFDFSTNLTAGRLSAIPTVSGNTVTISVTIAPAANLNWNSTTSGVWDTSASNWFNADTLAVDKFVNGDQVNFNDSTSSPVGSPQTAITLAGTVTPSIINVSANSKNYTISGAGKISGSGVLNVTGSGTLTLKTNNDFSGGTNITNAAATVDVGGNSNSGLLGTGDVLNNGTLKFTRTDGTALNPVIFVNNISGTGNLINSGPLATTLSGNISQASITLNGGGSTILSGSSVTTTGNITVSNTTTAQLQGSVTAGADIIVNNTANVIASGGVNGSGGITMNSTGTFTISSSNGYDGNTIINAGTFVGNSASAFGDTNGTTTVNSVGSINVNNANGDYGTESITINGSGTNTNGALHTGGATTSTFDGVITVGSSTLLNLDGGSTLALSGTGNGISLASSTPVVITLAGSGGAGTLSISGNINLASGSSFALTTLGTLNTAGNIAFAPTTGTLVVSPGISGTGSITVNTGGSPSEGSLATTALNNSLASFAGPITINTGNLAVQAGATGLFTWVPSGTNSLTITGQGASTTAVVGTLLLAPTSGNLPNLTVPITLDGRQGTGLNIPHIENQIGNNTISGALTLQTGGAEYYFQSDAGTFTIQSNISSTALASARDITVMGAGNGVLSGGLTDNATAPITLVQAGSGAWTLPTSNTLNGGLVFNSSGTLKIASGTTQTFAGIQTATTGVAVGTNDGLYVLSGSPHIDLGTGTGASLKVADSSASGWGGTLTIDNWTYGAGANGDHVIVGITSTVNPGGTGLSPTQLTQIQFADFFPGASLTTIATAARAVGEVTPLIGDVNQDGHVDAKDIIALEKALTDTGMSGSSDVNSYAHAHPLFTNSDILFALDVNGDGKDTNTDVQSLINYLLAGNGSNAPVPEPSSLVLLAISGFTLLGYQRRRAKHQNLT
jgi:autotransporter-associated beta strand protein